MSQFFFCRLTSFILFWLTVLGADQRNHGQQTISAKQEMEDAERRNWRLRQQQLRHLSFLRYQKRKFVASIFALRHGQGRLPRDWIHSVVNQWTPLTPGMTMGQLIQCRDLRFESFLNRKCGQEIDHQLSLCNQNKESRITLYNNVHQDAHKVYEIHYFDRASKEMKFATMDAPKMIADAETMNEWYPGSVAFTERTWCEPLVAHLLGQKDLSISSGFVMLQTDFIKQADGSVTVTVGWSPGEIEVKDIITV